MSQEEPKREVKLVIPSGLILGPIGLLVLITPLAAEVPAHQLGMNLVAGGVLLAAGLICLALGLRRPS